MADVQDGPATPHGGTEPAGPAIEFNERHERDPAEPKNLPSMEMDEVEPIKLTGAVHQSVPLPRAVQGLKQPLLQEEVQVYIMDALSNELVDGYDGCLQLAKCNVTANAVDFELSRTVAKALPLSSTFGGAIFVFVITRESADFTPFRSKPFETYTGVKRASRSKYTRKDLGALSKVRKMGECPGFIASARTLRDVEVAAETGADAADWAVRAPMAEAREENEAPAMAGGSGPVPEGPHPAPAPATAGGEVLATATPDAEDDDGSVEAPATARGGDGEEVTAARGEVLATATPDSEDDDDVEAAATCGGWDEVSSDLDSDDEALLGEAYRRIVEHKWPASASPHCAWASTQPAANQVSPWAPTPTPILAGDEEEGEDFGQWGLGIPWGRRHTRTVPSRVRLSDG